MVLKKLLVNYSNEDIKFMAGIESSPWTILIAALPVINLIFCFAIAFSKTIQKGIYDKLSSKIESYLKLERELDNFGIKYSRGDTIEIMLESIAKKWPSLSDDDHNNISKLIGGSKNAQSLNTAITNLVDIYNTK